MDAVVHLNSVSNADLKPYLIELLEWVQDINWPVALPIAERLADCGTEIVDPLEQILQSDDATWKYWVLSEIVHNASREVRGLLTTILMNLMDNPSQLDKDEEVDLLARKIMVQYNQGI